MLAASGFRSAGGRRVAPGARIWRDADGDAAQCRPPRLPGFTVALLVRAAGALFGATVENGHHSAGEHGAGAGVLPLPGLRQWKLSPRRAAGPDAHFNLTGSVKDDRHQRRTSEFRTVGDDAAGVGAASG